MPRWEEWPNWPNLIGINNGNRYEAGDGITFKDINTILIAAQCLRGPAAKLFAPNVYIRDNVFYVINDERNGKLATHFYIFTRNPGDTGFGVRAINLVGSGLRALNLSTISWMQPYAEIYASVRGVILTSDPSETLTWRPT